MSTFFYLNAPGERRHLNGLKPPGLCVRLGALIFFFAEEMADLEKNSGIGAEVDCALYLRKTRYLPNPNELRY